MRCGKVGGHRGWGWGVEKSVLLFRCSVFAQWHYGLALFGAQCQFLTTDARGNSAVFVLVPYMTRQIHPTEKERCSQSTTELRSYE